ncbi:hypothetical protein TELCIR_09292, partial [Teladorsagia circumcincta]
LGQDVILHFAGKRRRSGLQDGPQNKKSRYDDIEPCKAPYIEVIKLIGLSQEDWLKAASLSPKAVESISNITDMFRIERSPENKLMLKYRAAEWRIEDCTVYLDNLPLGCTAEKVARFARKFGTVVEVRVPRTSSRPVPSRYGIIEVGKHSRSFAFLQFTGPEACQNMCEFSGKTAPSDDHVDGEHNISNSDCGEGRRLSCGKKKKSKGHRLNSEKKHNRKKRRRRRKRRTEIGPHTVIGSLNDYFAKIQVFSFTRYMELRQEYIALRRQSDSQASASTRKDSRFAEFASRLCDGKLRHKLESYRDCYWNADMAEEV